MCSVKTNKKHVRFSPPNLTQSACVWAKTTTSADLAKALANAPALL